MTEMELTAWPPIPLLTFLLLRAFAVYSLVFVFLVYIKPKKPILVSLVYLAYLPFMWVFYAMSGDFELAPILGMNLEWIAFASILSVLILGAAILAWKGRMQWVRLISVLLFLGMSWSLAGASVESMLLDGDGVYERLIFWVPRAAFVSAILAFIIGLFTTRKGRKAQ